MPPFVASRVHIHLDRLKRNVRTWRSIIGEGTRLGAVVKQDAYGLGAEHVVPTLAAAGVDWFIVYHAGEAEQVLQTLRTCGAWDGPRPIELLMMSPGSDATLGLGGRAAEAFAAGRLSVGVERPQTLWAIGAAARRVGRRIPVHLHLDTGMSRGGLSREAFSRLLPKVDSQGAELRGVWTHMACATGDRAALEQQHRRFDHALAAHRSWIGESVVRHTAATHTALRGRVFHRSGVRIGLGLFGYGPAALPAAERLPEADQLLPIFRWTTQLVHVSQYPRGTAVGYGATHRLERPSLLGVVPVGYGDGYPFTLEGGGEVEIAGRSAPILGRVSMNQTVVDLTDLPPQTAPGPGMSVTLVSDNPASSCSLDRLATRSRTIPYELLCRLSPRLPRVLDEASSASAAHNPTPAPQKENKNQKAAQR